MSRRLSPTVELYRRTDLSAGSRPVGAADTMPTFVSQNGVGLNFMEAGRMQVLLSTGYRYVLGPGQLAVFWGATPHKVEAYGPGSVLHWLLVPLGTFFHWTCSKEFVNHLMRGRVFIEPDESEGANDLVLLNRWRKTLGGKVDEGRAIVLLELEARIRRLAQSCLAVRTKSRIVPQGQGSQAERMLLLIAERFREPLGVADVAGSVGLHPIYAGQLFRRHIGMGMNDYITECRLSHAKALLAGGDTKILDVAIKSGFGSISRFHAIFKRQCACTPRAFRKSVREPTPPASRKSVRGERK